MLGHDPAVAGSDKLTTLPTGVYSYTLEVQVQYGGVWSDGAQAPGRLLVVNRKASPHGNANVLGIPGWSIAGVEELRFLSGDTILWVGGDGSARVYSPVSGQPGSWEAPKVDRPDRLTRESGVLADGSTFHYVRHLPQGVRVVFKPNGQHAATINRLRHLTAFGYDGSGRLASIGVPGGHTYTFDYVSEPGVVKLVAPAASLPGGAPQERITRIGTSGGRVDWIQDADFAQRRTQTSFHYEGTSNRIRLRTDRRGKATEFEYGPGARRSTLFMDVAGQADITTRFTPAETRGIAGPVPSGSVFTLVNGPRADTTVTSFWLDRFGAPRKVVNARGDSTVLTRGNLTYPALVTGVRYPNGRRVSASYDLRGNLETQTELDLPGTCSNGRSGNAVTRYTWTARDLVETVELPCGEKTTFEYDENGSRKVEQAGTDVNRRVRYDYHPLDHATAPGLVHQVHTPAPLPASAGSVVTETIEYDGRGNLRATRSPLGHYALYEKDAIGRDTLIVTPTVDSAYAQSREGLRWSAYGLHKSITYDLLDREEKSVTVGPALAYEEGHVEGMGTMRQSDRQTVRVGRTFDDEGNLLTLTRSTEPQAAHAPLTTEWKYDAAGRMIEEITPGNRSEVTRYDPAANVVSRTTRRGKAVTMAYDSLNRMVRREYESMAYGTVSYPIRENSADVRWYFPMFLPDANGSYETRNTGGGSLFLPGDVETFRYDMMGNLVEALNRDAKVTRGYDLAGRLTTDTLRIREYGETTLDTHRYVLGYGYDLNSRRTRLDHPANIAPTNPATGQPATTVRYAYDAVGALETVTDVFDSQYRFEYDLGGRLRRTRMPGSIQEEHVFDDGSRELQRVVRPYTQTDPGGVPEGDSWLLNDRFTYDACGKILRAGTRMEAVRNAYNGLGMLQYTTRRRADDRTFLAELHDNDGLGNVRWIERAAEEMLTSHPTYTSTAYHYNEKGEHDLDLRLPRVQGDRAQVDWSGAILTDDYSRVYHDIAGNRDGLEASRTIKYGDLTAKQVEHSRYYYDGSDRLRVVDRRVCNAFWVDGSMECDSNRPPEYAARSAIEEYRYDPLGRRVLVRSRSEYACKSNCVNSIQRTVWDGDQILYELRYRGGTGISRDQMEQDVGRVQGGETAYTFTNTEATGRRSTSTGTVASTGAWRTCTAPGSTGRWGWCAWTTASTGPARRSSLRTRAGAART